MPSWVETTCPPGWGVMEESDVHWSVFCCEPGGDDRFVHEVWGDRCKACRLAWERWALEVLGDRVLWEVLADRTFGVTAVGPRGREAAWVYRGPRDTCYTIGDESDRDDEITARDPVEALARLAFLTGAVLGPEVHGAP